MRCQYCHNPDTWDMKVGTPYTADELLKKAVRYKGYWGKEGGITVSGGEPMLQIDFLTELFRKAKAQGIHTTLDTSGNPFTREGERFEKIRKLLKIKMKMHRKGSQPVFRKSHKDSHPLSCTGLLYH